MATGCTSATRVVCQRISNGLTDSHGPLHVFVNPFPHPLTDLHQEAAARLGMTLPPWQEALGEYLRGGG